MDLGNISHVTGQFLVTKGINGEPIWVAVHTNKFLDDDIPPDILSEAAHKDFISRVERGEAPMPSLWLWHLPVPIGETKTLAWHDAGFMISAGTFASPEWGAALAKSKIPLAMSHGMYRIERDKKQRHIITSYTTHEISVLPYVAAANKLTMFDVGRSEKMIIDAVQRRMMVEMIGEQQVALIETALDGVGEKAIAEGRLFKALEQAGLMPAMEETMGTKDTGATVTESETVEEAAQEEAEAIVADVIAAVEADVADAPVADAPVADAPTKADPEEPEETPDMEEQDPEKADPEMAEEEPGVEAPAADADVSALRDELATLSEAFVTLVENVGAALERIVAEQGDMAKEIKKLADASQERLSEVRQKTVSGAIDGFMRSVGTVAKSAIGDVEAEAGDELAAAGPRQTEDKSGRQSLFTHEWMRR